MEPQDFTDFHEIKEEKMISLFKSCDNLVLICGLISLCSSVVKLLFSLIFSCNQFYHGKSCCPSNNHVILDNANIGKSNNE